MISCGVSILYSSFMTSKKKLEERLGMPMSQIAEVVSKTELPPEVCVYRAVAFCVSQRLQQKYLILDVCVEADDEDIETPYVRLKFR